MPRRSPSFQPHKSNTQTPSPRDDIKGKSFERDNRHKGPDSSRVSSTTKCYICQGYGHLAASYPNLIRITIINGTLTEATKSDSTSLREKIMKLTKSLQVMTLASTVLIKYYQLTCLSLNVSPPHPMKKTIGEKVLPFTR